MKQKLDDIDTIDRLDDLANLAAAVVVGLIGLEESNWQPARSGFMAIANQIHDGIKEVSEALYSETRKAHKLRLVKPQSVAS